MRTFLVVSVLIVSVFSGDYIRGETTAPPTVSQILDAWKKRASSFESGTISWKVPAESWNLFGRFETNWVSDSTPADREITGTLSFTNESARYDSFSFTYGDYGNSNSRAMNVGLSFSKNSRFGFVSRECIYRELLPYTVIFSPDDRLYFWHGNEKDNSLAIILPADPELYTRSQKKQMPHSSTVLHQFLTAPVLLTFRPMLYDCSLAQENTRMILDELQPAYEGRPCLVLRVSHVNKKTPKKAAKTSEQKNAPLPTEHIYWVDPSRDYVVVRYIDKRNKKPVTQIDIHYDQIVGIGWVPNTWTVLQYGHHLNVVRRAVMAVRTEVNVGQAINDARMQVSFPPRTQVIDTLKDQQYILGKDQSKLSTTNLLSSQRDPKGSVKAYRILISLLRWPRILIPVTLFVVILLIINRWLVRRRTPRPESEESTIEKSDSYQGS